MLDDHPLAVINVKLPATVEIGTSLEICKKPNILPFNIIILTKIISRSED